MPVTFPSEPFFQALAAAMAGAHDRFRGLGFFDATIGIRVQPAVREKLAATEKSTPSTPGGPATGDSILPVPSRQVLR